MKITIPHLDNDNLDQWIRTSPKKTASTLESFKKLTLDEKAKIRLPAILTSDNTSTWLVTRKNQSINQNPESAGNWTIRGRGDQMTNDNDKWLVKPSKKISPENLDSNLASVTDEFDKWLLNPRPTCAATALDELPGKRTGTGLIWPENLSGPAENWLISGSGGGKKSAHLNEGWLLVPSTGFQNENWLLKKTGFRNEKWLGKKPVFDENSAWLMETTGIPLGFNKSLVTPKENGTETLRFPFGITRHIANSDEIDSDFESGKTGQTVEDWINDAMTDDASIEILDDEEPEMGFWLV